MIVVTVEFELANSLYKLGMEWDFGVDFKTFDDSLYCFCPPQSLAQKFLRESFNVDCESRAVRYAGDEKSSHYNSYFNGSVTDMKRYDTYEKALEVSLNFAVDKLTKLNLI